MAENDQAGKDQPPSPNPLSFDDVERVADSFTPLWEAPAPVAPGPAPAAAPVPPPAPSQVIGGGTQMLSTPAQVIAAPGGHGLPQAVPAPIPVEPRPVAPAPASAAPQPAQARPTGNPLANKTMLGMAPPPGVAAAFAAAAPPAAAPIAPFAPPAAVAPIPAPVAPVAPPEPGPAQRRPSPIPEEAAPDSKSEYAPPRALPAAQRAVGMSSPVSVDVPGRLGAVSPQAAPAQSYYEPDDDSAKLDTIPPRRRQAGARRIVFGVMGVAIALVAAVGLRQVFQSKGADSGAPARTEAVTAKPQGAPGAPAPQPSTTTTEVAAAPPPPPEPEPAAPSSEAPEPDKAAVEAKPHEPLAEAAPRAARTPPHRAAPAPRPEKKQAAHTKEPRPVAAPPPPSPGGGSIVRESPF